MSNSNNVHRRTLSSKSLKTQRPVLVRGPSSPRLQSLGKKRTAEVETTSDSEDPDDMTFLQYCPTCDKQIIVPNSSILYCSESCRRKDGAYRDPTMSLDNPLVSDSEDSSVAPRTIVAPRHPSTLASFASKPPVLHGFKADLDPTEWKPDSLNLSCPTIVENEGRPHHHRAQSAAFNFLSGFHSSTAAFLTGRRPALPSRASTSALPLAHTAPSTTLTTPAMSAGSSTSSTESGFLRTPEYRGHNLAGADTTLRPYVRPSGIKSIDLVKPMFNGKAFDGNAVTEGKAVGLENVDYTKKSLAPAAIGGAENVAIAGSLSKLLSHGAAHS